MSVYARMRRPLPPAGSDAGFTLVELLVTVVILGIVTTVITGALIVGLRTSDATAARLSESHDAQLVSTYLVGDVQSAGADSGGVVTDPGAATGCGPAGDESEYTGASNVLRLRWTQTEPSPVTYYAAYRVARHTADQLWQLVRYTCTDGGAARAVVLAHQLKDPAVTAPAVDTSHLPAISLTLTEPSGYQYTVSAVRRTASVTPLPSVPWACTVLSAAGTPDPATMVGLSPGALQSDLRVDVQSGGSPGQCGTLKIVVDPGGSSPRTQSLAESPPGSGAWTTMVSRTADTWTAGDKALAILNGSTTLATLNITVHQPCVATAFTATPATVTRVAGTAPTALGSDIALAVSTSGFCEALTVDYAPRSGVSSSVALTENVTGGGSWSGTVTGSAETWTDGPHVLTVRQPGGPALLTTTLTVTAE